MMMVSFRSVDLKHDLYDKSCIKLLVLHVFDVKNVIFNDIFDLFFDTFFAFFENIIKRAAQASPRMPDLSAKFVKKYLKNIF